MRTIRQRAEVVGESAQCYCDQWDTESRAKVVKEAERVLLELVEEIASVVANYCPMDEYKAQTIRDLFIEWKPEPK